MQADNDHSAHDALPVQLASATHTANRGRLKTFFDTATLDKTTAMLQAARQKHAQGVNVLLGLVDMPAHIDPHLLEGLEHLPPLCISHHEATVQEFDLDTALKRRPQLVLLSDLAHANVHGNGNCHLSRSQDVQALLNAGIDVYITI